MFSIIEKINRRFMGLVLKHRIRHRRLLKYFWIIYSFLAKFAPYKNSYEKEARHHYIPQFILKNFKTNTPNCQNCIWELDTASGKIEEVSISKKAANKIDFYTFRDKHGKRSNFTEKRLYGEFLEPIVHKIINIIRDVPDPDLNDFEESILASFVSDQFSRTPMFREHLRFFVHFLLEKKGLDKEKLKDLDVRESLIVKNEGAVTEKDLEDFIRTNRNFLGGTGTEDMLVITASQIGNNISETWFRKKLFILTAKQGNYFVLSDNPVIIIDSEKEKFNLLINWWSMDKDSLLMFMPISPTKCILYTTQSAFQVFTKKAGDVVKTVNAAQFFYSKEFVYGPDKDYILSQEKIYKKVT
jgi:hypothetical protein